MSQVLALKYRPRRFEDLIGQGTISQTLSLALDSNRLSHAYLFSGLRGSGKTSTARIMSKALLCSNGPTSKPCDVCDNCKAANDYKHIDIIEMDAASNRGIDDIKELIEHTKYKPSSAKYKVFIIDEVHMLTPQAFNALLKTLEEPPAFVKFILATTDPLKLPATILSRTQHFRFKKISQKDVINHLSHILRLENIEFEKEALEVLSRTGQGSLRDTLTMLDQAIIFAKGRLSVSAVTDMLGLIDPAFMNNMFDLILNRGDINNILHELEDYEAGLVIDEMTIYLRNKMLENDARFDILMYDRFFRILADAKQLLFLNSDSSFVLILTFSKMVEATNLRTINEIINEVEKIEATPDPIKPQVNIAQSEIKGTVVQENITAPTQNEPVQVQAQTINSPIEQETQKIETTQNIINDPVVPQSIKQEPIVQTQTISEPKEQVQTQVPQNTNTIDEPITSQKIEQEPITQTPVENTMTQTNVSTQNEIQQNTQVQNVQTQTIPEPIEQVQTQVPQNTNTINEPITSQKIEQEPIIQTPIENTMIQENVSTQNEIQQNTPVQNVQTQTIPEPIVQTPIESTIVEPVTPIQNNDEQNPSIEITASQNINEVPTQNNVQSSSDIQETSIQSSQAVPQAQSTPEPMIEHNAIVNEPIATIPLDEPIIEPIAQMAQVVKTDTVEAPTNIHMDKFNIVIKNIYERNYDLANCFEKNFFFDKLENDLLYIRSIAEGECKKLLWKEFSHIRIFIEEVFGENTQIEFIKDLPQPENVTKINTPIDIPKEEETKEEAPEKKETVELGNGGCVADMHNSSNEKNIPSQREEQIEEILNGPMVNRIKELFDPKKIIIKSKV